MNYIQFIDTPELMGDTFQGESRQPMRTVLTAAYGLPLTDDQTSFFPELVYKTQTSPTEISDAVGPLMMSLLRRKVN